jgi:hypothetical protein
MVKVNRFIAFPDRVKLDSQNNCLYSDLFVIVKFPRGKKMLTEKFSPNELSVSWTCGSGKQVTNRKIFNFGNILNSNSNYVLIKLYYFPLQLLLISKGKIVPMLNELSTTP